MNRNLMMKAAVQLKGVWPDVDTLEYNQLAVCLKRVGYCTEGNIYAVCKDAYADHWQIFGTREQFEDFVTSLFECAPADATHYSPEDKNNEQAWWKLVGDEMLCICEIGGIHTWERGHFDKTIQLIPRPAKKAEPQAPWVPKVGEECESALVGSGFRVGQLLYRSEKLIVWQDAGTGDETANRPEHRIFRPLRTERELFIEQATKDYLDQVGSDAVNSKWFERIFGELYDAGYTKTRD